MSPARRPLALLGLAAAGGALGALPGAAGALDPVSLLGWLVLFAPAAGALCSELRPGRMPLALSVPAAWALMLALAQVRALRALPTLPWALLALVGLFALGLAAGRRTRAPLRSAGLLLFLMLGLSGLALGFGLLAGGAELARAHPSAAARLLDLSPLVFIFDCAGWDWSHAQPQVYARAGIEWFQRRPYPGNLAGPAVLVVGCALAVLVREPPRAAREA